MPVFAPLIGQPQAVELLSQAIARDRIAPAYLFTGPAGVGKRLAAECFLELLLSKPSASHKDRQPPPAASVLKQRIAQRNHPDLLWVEPTYLHQGKRLSATEAEAAGVKRKTPPQVRLEQIREIARFLSRPPLQAERSVVVIKQAETMAEPAANALLKTLEEPGQATLILLAPSTDALLPTLVSRCQRIPFYRLSHETVAQVLANDYGEILEHSEVLALAEGSPGAAIAHWRRLQAIPQELLEAVRQVSQLAFLRSGGSQPEGVLKALTIARQIDKALDTEAQLWLVDYLQHLYWQQAAIVPITPLQQLEKAREALLAYVQSRLVWEVTLLGMIQD